MEFIKRDFIKVILRERRPVKPLSSISLELIGSTREALNEKTEELLNGIFSSLVKIANEADGLVEEDCNLPNSGKIREMVKNYANDFFDRAICGKSMEEVSDAIRAIRREARRKFAKYTPEGATIDEAILYKNIIKILKPITDITRFSPSYYRR